MSLLAASDIDLCVVTLDDGRRGMVTRVWWQGAAATVEFITGGGTVVERHRIVAVEEPRFSWD